MGGTVATARRALGLHEYLSACGEEGATMGELATMLELSRYALRRLLSALARCGLVERVGRSLWRATEEEPGAAHRLGALLRRKPRPRARRPRPAAEPARPVAPPPLAERPPWRPSDGLPPLALQRCPLPGDVLRAVARPSEGRPPTTMELLAVVPVTRREIRVALAMLEGEGLIHRGASGYGLHSRWWPREIYGDAVEALVRATIRTEIGLRLLGLGRRASPLDDTDEPEEEEEMPETEDGFELSPGMRGLCCYDTSPEGRAERAGALLFALPAETRWPEVGVEWETEGEDG